MCLFLGYGIEQKGYRCYDPKTQKLRVSRHVTLWEKIPFYSLPRFRASSLSDPESFLFLDPFLNKVIMYQVSLLNLLWRLPLIILLSSRNIVRPCSQVPWPSIQNLMCLVSILHLWRVICSPSFLSVVIRHVSAFHLSVIAIFIVFCPQLSLFMNPLGLLWGIIRSALPAGYGRGAGSSTEKPYVGSCRSTFWKVAYGVRGWVLAMLLQTHRTTVPPLRESPGWADT